MRYQLAAISMTAGIAAVGLSGQSAAGAVVLNTVGVYDESGATNAVDTTASTTAFTLPDFKTAVSSAFNANTGGVYNFDATGTTSIANTVLDARYGTSAGRKLSITSNKSLSIQTMTSGTVISGHRGAVLGTNSTAAGGNDFTLTFGVPSTVSPAAALPQNVVQSVGVTLLSRDSTGYGISVTVTAAFSGGGSQSSTFSLAKSKATNDTFVAFNAPAFQGITSLSFDVPNATSTNDTRVLLDDLAFITTTVPEPTSIALLGLGATALCRRRRRAEPLRASSIVPPHTLG